MKKTTISPFLRPGFQLDVAHVQSIDPCWNHVQLPGIHWRLYHNDRPGSGLIHPDGSRIALAPDSLYLIPPATRAGSYSESSPQQLFLHFHLENCRVKGTPVFIIALDDMLRNLLVRTRELLLTQENSPAAQFSSIALATAVLARLPVDALIVAESDSRIVQACELMRAHPEKAWRNSELAERFYFSTNAFTRRFREVMGITPHHYLQEIRYALAAQLLESTSLTIGEICEKIGIRDPFHFSREFKRYHERSPSLYRKVRQGTAKM